jgi:hypothetical protein
MGVQRRRTDNMTMIASATTAIRIHSLRSLTLSFDHRLQKW